MMGTTKIENLGVINLSDVAVKNGQLEVHIPIEIISEEFDRILDECTADYMKKYRNVKSCNELNYDIRVVFSCGSWVSDDNEIEFSLIVIVWQKVDDMTAEFYEEIPVTLDGKSLDKIKRVIWDALGKMLLGI
ncbi:hypothetical protein AALC75_22525 [Lachnospiraceae bacterium 48-42]